MDELEKDIKNALKELTETRDLFMAAQEKYLAALDAYDNKVLEEFLHGKGANKDGKTN